MRKRKHVQAFLAYYARIRAFAGRLAGLAGRKEVRDCAYARRGRGGGLAKVQAIMELEMEMGLRSSFNLIPDGSYRVLVEAQRGDDRERL